MSIPRPFKFILHEYKWNLAILNEAQYSEESFHEEKDLSCKINNKKFLETNGKIFSFFRLLSISKQFNNNMKKVTLTSCGDNSGKLEFNSSQSKIIEIKRGRFILPDKNSNPLYDEDNKYYKRIYSLEYNNKIIYYFKLFGNKESKFGYHVGFNFWEHQQFLWLQNQHWLQKEENIRYCVNVLFLLIGVCISFSKVY